MSILRRPVLRALALAGVAALLVVRGASPAPEGERELWMAVPADAASVRLLVDGEPVTGTVGAGTEPWRVVLVFDRLLSTPLAFRNGAVRLSQSVDRLVALGPVEALVVDEDVRRAVPATREAQALAEALSWLRLRETVEGAQEALRAELVVEIGRDGAEPGEAQELALQALRQEAAMVREQLDALLLWAADNPPSGPGLLVLVGSGFDPPAAFYGALPGLENLGPDAVEWPRVEEVGAALSAVGWTVVPLALAEESDALLAGGGEGVDEQERLEDEVEAAVVGEESGGEAVLFEAGEIAERLRERRRGRERPLLLEPRAGRAPLAAATGGTTVDSAAALDEVLADLAAWRPVRWPAAPGGRQVVAAEAAEAAPRWSYSGTPLALSEARARALLDSEAAEGELEIAALAEAAGGSGGAGRLVVETAIASWPAGPPERLRITWAVGHADGRVEAHHREVAASDLEAGRWEVPLADELEGRPALAVVVDSPVRPGWGATFAGWVEGERGEGRLEDVDALLLPAPGIVHLLDAGGGVLLGPVQFRTVVSSTEVERVEFLLDGEREAVRRTPPFSAELDLGKLPRIRRVEVVAFDATGRELGRDSMVVNGGAGAFQVTLREVGKERTASGVTAVGRLVVEADVRAPRERRVRRVEFYWRDEPLGSVSSPPYRRTVRIPEDRPQGFVRAVATLLDGTSAEDVLFVNTPGSAESLEVNLVQLYVVVTDGEGNPVRGVPREAFTVREKGETREIASFGDASDLPLTLGLAVDSSASMFIKLPDVKVAAIRFLRALIGARDRGFIVGFGGQPRLYSRPSGDLAYLVRGVESMAPDGHTAIWKSVVYSLVQLQGVPGKKALIVYSDGADEDPDFSYRTVRRFARLVGVPIYVILSNNEIVRTGGAGLNIRAFLDRLEELTGEVGGRVYLTRVGQDLAAVYAQIADELRSQYVLGYYAESSAQGEWREIEVEVERPGLEARAASGYWH